MNKFTTMSMTPVAIEHLQKKIAEQGSGTGLRVALKKRGCSGLAYDLSIVTDSGLDETRFSVNETLFIVVPNKDLPFVIGTTIDYVRTGLNAQFVFLNPHEVASCGCGESFTVA